MNSIPARADAGSFDRGFTRGLAAAVFIEDGFRRTRSEAGAAEVTDHDEAIEIPHPTGGFHLHVRRAVLAHEADIVLRGAFVIVATVWLLAEAIASGGLYPICASAGADLTELDLGVIAG